MKKFFAAAIIALTTIGFIGCFAEEDDTKADVKWSNDSGSFVQEIKWVSGGSIDQTWGGTTNAGSETGFKGIKALSGSGDCLDSTGDNASIVLGSASTGTTTTLAGNETSATIQENASADLVISSVAKK